MTDQLESNKIWIEPLLLFFFSRCCCVVFSLFFFFQKILKIEIKLNYSIETTRTFVLLKDVNNNIDEGKVNFSSTLKAFYFWHSHYMCKILKNLENICFLVPSSRITWAFSQKGNQLQIFRFTVYNHCREFVSKATFSVLGLRICIY
jgi:hypothetical protein